ncbi:hypothetical protein Tel_06405 [Candidatus Tenderia electrophaga]|uniref:Uncharacterized protein n=1 Tax=Candidatus Tenderia electrophaga TaxID=1748243 RepID=A0A0S2TCE7_9GAMM|nr:hypothetical protein Tel_06405 [Candidatus Tenderia electrophaga]
MVLLGMPITGMGQAPVPVTGVTIEIEGSLLAVPEDIQLRRTDQVIEVTGKLNRRRHNNQGLRGHVDVELVVEAGRMMKSESVAIPRSLVSAKHDHFREFSVMLPLL